MPRAQFIALLGLLLTLIAVLIPRPQGSAASDITRWSTALAADQHALVAARRDLDATTVELQRVTREHDMTVDNVSDRMVSIYKSGGTSGVGNVVANVVQTKANSVSEAEDAADVLSTVEHHDNASMRRYQKLSRRISALKQQQAALRSRIHKLRERISRDRAKLAAAREVARKAAAEARARAARLERERAVPLAPRAIAPATAAAATAHQLDDSASSDKNSDSGSGASVQHDSPPQSAGISESGIASMYSDEMAGDATASGEPYDPSAMTAAHRTLPLGTWVSVRGPGGTAMVRINDRGPFVGGRIIDLSRAAANAVGLGGLGQVTISVQG